MHEILLARSFPRPEPCTLPSTVKLDSRTRTPLHLLRSRSAPPWHAEHPSGPFFNEVSQWGLSAPKVRAAIIRTSTLTLTPCFEKKSCCYPPPPPIFMIPNCRPHNQAISQRSPQPLKLPSLALLAHTTRYRLNALLLRLNALLLYSNYYMMPYKHCHINIAVLAAPNVPTNPSKSRSNQKVHRVLWR
jgi:hypothetical protein